MKTKPSLAELKKRPSHWYYTSKDVIYAVHPITNEVCVHTNFGSVTSYFDAPVTLKILRDNDQCEFLGWL